MNNNNLELNNNTNNNQMGGKRRRKRRRRKRGGAAFVAGPSQMNLNTQNEIAETHQEISNIHNGQNVNNSVSVESVSTVNSPVPEKKKSMFSDITNAFSGMGNKVKGVFGMAGGRRHHGGVRCATTLTDQNSRDNYCREMMGDNYSCVGGDNNSKGECKIVGPGGESKSRVGGRRKKRKTHKKHRKSHKKHRKSHKKRGKSHKKRGKSHKKRRTHRRRR